LSRHFLSTAGVVLVLIFAIVAGFRIGALTHERLRLQSCSADGSYCASVVMQSSIRGSGSDAYITRVKSTKPFEWSHWASFGKGTTVLQTTDAAPTRLIWSGDTLSVFCDQCKMNYGDVWDERDRVNSASVNFVGFFRPLE
jgi:hypothetical protein